MTNLYGVNEAAVNDTQASDIPVGNTIVKFFNKVGKTNPVRFQKFGYEVDIHLANEIVPQTLLTGNFTYQKSSGQVTTLSFTLLNKAGIQNPEYYMGKPVTVRITTNSGIYNLFTGYVDTPSVDLIEERTTFNCSDRRNKRIKNLTARSATFPRISAVGRYSESLFSKPKDKLDELEKRLQTVAASFDFDNNGNPQLTSWTPKATPDFILNGTPGAYNADKVYYTEPKVDFTDFSARLNTININLSHSFQRLHYQVVHATWTMGFADPWAWIAAGSPSFVSRSTIISAAKGTSWEVVYGPTFTPVWPAQAKTVGAGGAIGVQIWEPNKVTRFTRPKMRIDGYIYIGEGINRRRLPMVVPVLDKDNNQIMEVYRTEITNTTSELCVGGSWQAVKRFSQNVIHNFAISIRVPSTRNKFEEVLSEESVTVNSDFNVDEWGKKTLGTIRYDENKYFDQMTNKAEVDNALKTAYEKAKVALLQAHRDVRVSVDRSLFPQIDVTHTVEINVNPLKCRGKVDSISHNINFSTGEAVTSLTLMLSRSSGVDTATPFNLVPEIADITTHVGVPKMAYFGSTYSTDTELAGAPGSNTGSDVGALVQKFTIGYPEMPPTLTENRELVANYTLNINIPNDYLVIESNVYSE